MDKAVIKESVKVLASFIKELKTEATKLKTTGENTNIRPLRLMIADLSKFKVELNRFVRGKQTVQNTYTYKDQLLILIGYTMFNGYYAMGSLVRCIEAYRTINFNKILELSIIDYYSDDLITFNNVIKKSKTTILNNENTV